MSVSQFMIFEVPLVFGLLVALVRDPQVTLVGYRTLK